MSITNSWSLLKLKSIKSVMPSNYLIICRPLLLLPSIFPSIRVFSNESALSIRCPVNWRFSFNISPSNAHLGLISFRMNRLTVQFSSVTQSCPTLSLPKLMFIESVMPYNHLILCCPLLLLTSIFPNIRVFSNESALSIRCPMNWGFSFNISPSNEHPGLISFRMDRLDLAVQGTLKSLLQHHGPKHHLLSIQLSV